MGQEVDASTSIDFAEELSYCSGVCFGHTSAGCEPVRNVVVVQGIEVRGDIKLYAMGVVGRVFSQTCFVRLVG